MNRLVCLGLQENENAQDRYPGDRERKMDPQSGIQESIQ